MQILDWASLSTEQQRQTLARSPLIGDASVEQRVRNIIEQVNAQGDSALLAYNKQFDGVELTQLALSTDEIAAACARV
ncbi:MAG TPA: histidinol dehydrogenase, partial [Shewanella frigidimarina]|nr:histidinol dehydrogenase [Shewanella frigidimarina]